MILVLGGTGFVGRSVVGQLAQKYPGQVRVMVRPNDGKGKGPSGREKLAAYKDIEIVEGDVLDPASLTTAMSGVDTVLDFAQVTANFKNKNNLYERVNVEGTRNVVAAAELAGVKKIILGSGLGTHADKPDTYMQTRWLSEEAVRHSKMQWVVLQPSIMFGKGGEFFEAQARIIKIAPFATIIGNGKTRFQPIFVEDYARCVVESIEREDKVGRNIPLGGPEYFTYKELINLIVKTLKKARLKLYLPLWAAKLNAGLFNLLPKPPLTPATLELFGFDNVTSDPAIVQHEYGFEPMTLEKYLAENGI